MPNRTFTPEELTDYLHLAPDDVERLMRETDMPREVRGGRTVFRRAAIDEWASKRILGLPGKRLDVYHEKSMRGTREVFPGGALIPDLMSADFIDLGLRSKTRASVIRDLVALAERTGRLFDPRELLTSVEEREALCPTALPGGFALLHARHHAAFRFEGSFIVLGRTIQAVPFGADDGGLTQVFFLVCCEDDRIHLHTLARLCMIALKTDVITQLHEAPSPAAAYEALVAAEKAVLPVPVDSAGARQPRVRRG
jgi:PTS system nitrogen regulatory IIA component